MEKIKKKQRNFFTTEVTPSGKVIERIRKGLKKVNIGDDVWLAGRITKIAKDPDGNLGSDHCVIYGPDNKEYHVYNKDVEFIKGDTSHWRYIRNHNNVDQSLLKIYILTSILDKRQNWCFDLKRIPAIGKLKVIYNNGTVKNIQFDGIFKEEELISKREERFYKDRHPKIKIDNIFTEDGKLAAPKWEYEKSEYSKYVKPVAYRII